MNHVLGWPGFEGAVWWIQAHTKDDRSWRLREMKELWAAEVSERTPLPAADLTEGAVDVEWFRQVYGEIGPERWRALDAAAKYAASSAGHTRAQLFARAMAGLVTRDELLGRIDASRHQDAVRALGLLPLAEGEAGQRDLLERYRRLEEFRRQARKFGSQRQQSEGRAVAIGLANLARTAGYRDPQRLQWAMEQRGRGGPRAGAGRARARRRDAHARRGRRRRAEPERREAGQAAQDAARRAQEGRRRSRRSRAGCRSSSGSGRGCGTRWRRRCAAATASARASCRTLLAHPILAPSLARLVFVGEGTAGYLADEGGRWCDHAGSDAVARRRPRSCASRIRTTCSRGGDWAAWQRECFRAERVQPFKQVFRELYPITDAERGTQRTRGGTPATR